MTIGTCTTRVRYCARGGRVRAHRYAHFAAARTILLAVLLTLAWTAVPASAKDNAPGGRPASPESERLRPPAPAPQRIVVGPGRDRMGAEIWTDHNDYYNGSKVRITFRATRDAYVYIFDTDTNGVTRQIFPNYYDTDNFVRGDAAYSIPDRNYSLTVAGPAGRESLEIVAVSERSQRIVREYEDFSSRRPFPEQDEGANGLMRTLNDVGRPQDREKADREEGRRDDQGRRPADEGRSTHSIPPQGQVVPDRPAAREVRPGPPDRIIITPPVAPVVVARAETSFRVRDPRWEEVQNGTLNVSSYPSRGRVYIDGRYIGTTPKVLALRPGSYELLVKVAGFASEEQYVNVSSDRETRIHFYLHRDRDDRPRTE